MNLNPYELADLIARHIQRKLSADESLRLLEWLHESEDNQRLFDRLVKVEQVKESFDFFEGLDADAAWEKAARKKQARSIKRVGAYFGYAAAAACLIFALLLFLPEEKSPSGGQAEFVTMKDLPPGGDKAVLKLSDGKVVYLDKNYAKISEFKGPHVICRDGELNYLNSKVSDNRVVHHVLSVPKSGTYRVVLADGTKVWLNSLSQLQFPVQFNRSQRIVKLTGEAYFEVAHNPAKPFLVEVDKQTVEVLGTHFNVNSYGAQMKTTLLEGSVRVSNAFTHQLLIPGQEAYLKGREILVKKADLKKASAWRNNEFYFRNESMPEVLREISRWYDFKIDLDQIKDHKRFSGTISRELKFSDVLKILHSLSGYDFHFDGTSLFINSQNPNHNTSKPQTTKPSY